MQAHMAYDSEPERTQAVSSSNVICDDPRRGVL